MIKFSIENLIIIGLIIYFLHINNIFNNIIVSTKKGSSCPKCQKCPKCNCNNLNNTNYQSRSYNYNQLFNPLLSPTKYLQNIPNYIKSFTTRGTYNYGVIGNISALTPNNKNIVLRLLGRPKHRGSSEWEYYGLDENNVKHTIDNNKEIYKGNTIKVNELDNLEFTVHTFDRTPDFLQYNPYI